MLKQTEGDSVLWCESCVDVHGSCLLEPFACRRYLLGVSTEVSQPGRGEQHFSTKRGCGCGAESADEGPRWLYSVPSRLYFLRVLLKAPGCPQ